MKKLLLVLLSLAMLFACDLGSDSDSKKEDEKKVETPEETTVTTGRAIVEDSNGVVLGEVVSMGSDIDIITPKGYFVRLKYDGSYSSRSSACYSSLENGAGDLYVDNAGNHYYKSAYRHYTGKFYEAADRDSKGIPIPVAKSVEINCLIFYDGTFDNSPQTNIGDFYKVVERTYAELGLVENISLPIVVKSSAK